MGHLIRHLIDHYGYAIVVVLVFAEGVGLPLPGETALITAAAFSAQSHRLSIFGVIIASIVGAAAGGCGGYWIGMAGGLPFLQRHGRHIGITKERIASARKFFTEHGPKAVFAARFIAILRMFAGVLAGVTKMRFWVFFLWNLLGAIAWSALFGTLGYVFGNRLPWLEHVVGRTSLIILGVVIVAGLDFLAPSPVAREEKEVTPRAVRSHRSVVLFPTLPVIKLLRGRAARLLAALIIANLAAWAWALSAFHAYPVLLGTALLAYGLGVRHAIDADHIAAIDNVTRKMMHDGKKPIGVGFFFSLGHSTVVVLASTAIAVTATALTRRFATFHAIGSMVGTIVSALFLLAIAIINVFVLVSVWRTFHRVRAGGRYVEEDLDVLLSGGGILARIFRPLFGMIRESWHMYPLGFLFGLGFDTATEIALLGISAAEASKGMSMWSIMVFPALFTVGMSLVDTIDSVMMASAYGWAFVKPIRKLYYNMTITFVSVLVALLVGGIEALGLIGDRLHATGGFWGGIAALNRNFGSIGYLIIAVFIATWILAAAFYRLKNYDALDVVEDARTPPEFASNIREAQPSVQR